ncbi:hypothetical protein H5V45_17480 [Nocardioides sp. KIGAM211]|uniref:WD40-like Beta Propeller Repeat n=1 Tax=Nocardioides luti TaxID=2761101 RepID=A0A7X0RIX4_9ACTN|nr:hypothetical protein [Nocardioides luti]MBB6629122.1 hypothetical protein [Nocardioides luti]
MRRIAVTLVLGVLTALLSLPVLAASASGSTLSFAPAAPVLGQSVTLKGSVPARARRTVRLQRLGGGSWTTVATRKTSRKGTFRFSVDTPAAATKYRVVAPKVAGAKRQAAVTTRTVAVPAGQAPQLVGTTEPAAYAVSKSAVEVSDDMEWWVVDSDDDLAPGLDPEYFNNLFLFHRGSSQPTLITAPDGVDTPAGPSLSDLSDDGRLVTYTFWGRTDTGNSFTELRLWDRVTQATTVIRRVEDTDDTNVASGAFGDTEISADDATVYYAYDADGDPFDAHQQLLAWDRATGETTDVLGGTPFDVSAFDLSPDGRYLAYGALAVEGGDVSGAGVHLRDRSTGADTLVSVTRDGSVPNGPTSIPSVSADGHHVAYLSLATDIDPGDHNTHADTYLVDTRTLDTTLLTTDGTGRSPNDPYIVRPVISTGGRYVSTGYRLGIYDIRTGWRHDALYVKRAGGEPRRLSRDLFGLSADGSKAFVDTADGKAVIWTRSG